MADNSIALGVQVPDTFKTIGSVMNIANQAQNYQRGGIALEKERQTLQPEIEQKKAESRSAQIKANLDQFKLTGEQTQKARDIATAWTGDSDFINGNAKGMIPKIALGRDNMIESGVPKDVAEVQIAHIQQAAAQDPKSVLPMLKNMIRAGVGASGQGPLLTPSGIEVTNNQQSRVININPLAGPPVGSTIPGTEQQLQVPPTAQTSTPSGQPVFVGPRAAGGGPIVAGPQPGVVPGIEGSVQAINKDWDNTVTAAKSAGTDIGLLQNIKKFAPGAIAGVDADRRAYLTGLSGLMKLKAGEEAKTYTDLLAKNTNMLALAGGDTNLARTMAEGANPNTHMTKEAIQDAANQLIAQRRLALEKQKLLQPIKGLMDKGLVGPDAYNSALAKLNTIDPRVLQLEEMNKEEKAKMMQAMSPQEQEKFIKMVRAAHAIGIGRE